VSEALQTVTEQRYFWKPEWQAREREVDEAIAKGRVRTFDTMEQMFEFIENESRSVPPNSFGRPTPNSPITQNGEPV
jgi:hypothetical protein